MEFTLTDEEIDADTHVVELQGELDLSTAPAFKRRLQDVIDAGKRRVVVDFTHAPFIDSTGMGVLVSALKRLRPEGGALVLVSDNPRMLELFSVTGLDRAMPIHETREEAVSSIAGARDSV